MRRVCPSAYISQVASRPEGDPTTGLVGVERVVTYYGVIKFNQAFSELRMTQK
jgi:hypothetical protein